VNVLAVDDKIIQLALQAEFNDFEDAIQHFTAIENSRSGSSYPQYQGL
jgi:hypothetical protein